jgi:hypothetical protein
MFKVTRRVYRTTDGRLVGHGDPDAAFLAYAVGDELSDSEARRRGLTAFFGGKAKTKPADKMGARPDDKAPSGLTVNRASRKDQADA